MKHFTNNAKEYLRKYDVPGQGKSKEQYKSNMKAIAFSFLGLFIVTLILIYETYF
jgi:hypothetical protein